MCVSERCESERERGGQDTGRSADPDLCDGSHQSEICTGETPHLSACEHHTHTGGHTRTYTHGHTLSHLYCLCCQGYLLSCAEALACQSDSKLLPDCLRWIFTPLGRQFFLSCDWSVRPESSEQIFMSQRDEGKTERPSAGRLSVWAQH